MTDICSTSSKIIQRERHLDSFWLQGVNEMEKNGIQSTYIDTSGYLHYLYNAPTITYYNMLNTKNLEKNISEIDVDIPRCGDLLLNINITGTFDIAYVYINPCDDSLYPDIFCILKKAGTLLLFPGYGFPMIYFSHLCLKIINPSNDIIISPTYAYLDLISRKNIFAYADNNNGNGVKLRKENGTSYQVVDNSKNSFYSSTLVQIKE